MKKKYSRRGSALLIVLGMFAFMLVSAVSFSIYMRSSRAPSSYVRRNAAARHLVKAALARAIDEIDTAIGNDPFPGVGYNHDYDGTGTSVGDRRKNDNWHGRVFTPSSEIAHTGTVSTLTLEALGYLPPCLINEVRYWSRHTRTAEWRSFNYGLGRYAFTAVNVSDFFDLNQFIDFDGVKKQRLNRSSSEHGRISPTYLFRSGSQGDMDTGSTASAAFLNAMTDGSGFGSSPSIAEVPLMSMMDFNLALGQNAPGGVASPFMKRLEGTEGTFYSSVGEDVVRRQLFMAGGWNGTNKTANVSQLPNVDLSYPECQPFHGTPNFPGSETGSKLTLADVFNSNNREFWGKKSGVFGTINVENNFPVVAQILLADYLDHDNIPLSLNLPCTEIAPMLVGIECDPKFSMKFKKDPTSEQRHYSDQGGQNRNIYNATFQADLSADPEITLQFVFPFRDVADRLINADRKYKVQVVTRLFFTSNNDNTLRMPRTSGMNLDFLSDADSDNQDIQMVWPTTDNDNGYSLHWGLKEVEFNAPDKDTYNETDYIFDVVVPMPRKQITCNLINAWDKTDYNNLLGAGTPYYDEQGAQVGTTEDASYPDGPTRAFRFLNYDNGALSFLDLNANPGARLRPSLAVWVRVVDPVDNDKIVDMVPATIKCDSWNNRGSQSSLKDVFGQYEAYENAGFSVWQVPFIRFFGDSNTEFSFTLLDIGTKADGTFELRFDQNTANPKAYLAGDPRYNWAPEDWYQGAPGAWWANVQGMLGTDGRDDFFMSVSNQGYLQSVYELMFIPRVRQLTPEDFPTFGFLEKNSGRNHLYDGVPRTALANTSHYGMMWRTYRQGNTDDAGNIIDPNLGWAGGDDLSKLNIDSGVQGPRVNPYTDSMELMMGAFANMPRDWWAAGTNHMTTGKGYMNPNSSTFDVSHLFDWSRNYNDVYNMAYYWMGAFRRWDINPSGKNIPNQGERYEPFHESDGWKDVLDEAVFWYNGNRDYNIPLATSERPNTVDSGILNSTTVEPILQDMTLAERKFLYGYLKGCFANTHQLFLVFVRAESAAGGGGAGSGARAVALVWRDPNAPSENGQFLDADGHKVAPSYGKDNANLYLDDRGTGNEEAWRLENRLYPPHRTRVLFYHQLD